MKKFCCFFVEKSGSHLIRHLWDIHRGPGFRRYDGGIYRVAKDGWENDKFIIGSIGRTAEAERVIKDREIWLLTRDPRDIVVSMWHWLRRREKSRSWAWCIKDVGRQGRETVAWEHVAKIFAFEDIILKPEATALRMSNLMEVGQHEVLKKLKYRGGKTYRKGKVGEFQKDFPNDLRELYEDECKEIRHWEHNAVS